MDMRASRWLMAVLAGAALTLLTGCPPMADVPAAGQTPVLERAVTLLVVESQNPDPATRANCVEALQLLPDKRALTVIEEGLHDREWVVRFASAMAAGRRRRWNSRGRWQACIRARKTAACGWR